MSRHVTTPRVLVTGALGNVGREVVLACGAAPGLIVRAAERRYEDLRERYPQHETTSFDFTRRETWAPALKDCDCVFLLRPPPLGDMSATLNPFVDVAYQSGIKHIVFLSVMRANEMTWVPHRKVELHLERHGAGWTVLRPGFFAQNLQDAYRRDIVEDGRLYVPAAQGRVAFLDVRDLGEVVSQIFHDPCSFLGKAITLTGPEALSFDEVASVLSGELARPIRYEAASIAGYAWHLRRRRGLNWTQIAVQTFLHVGLRNGDAERVEPALPQVLGKPARRLSEYISRERSSWR